MTKSDDVRNHLLGTISKLRQARDVLSSVIAKMQDETTALELMRALPKLTAAIAFAETALSRGTWVEWTLAELPHALT